jgi:hypothetical protein
MQGSDIEGVQCALCGKRQVVRGDWALAFREMDEKGPVPCMLTEPCTGWLAPWSAGGEASPSNSGAATEFGAFLRDESDAREWRHREGFHPHAQGSTQAL